MSFDGRKVNRFKCGQAIPDPADTADRERSWLLERFGQFTTGDIPGVMATEVLHSSNQRCEDPSVTRPKSKEICVLLENTHSRLYAKRRFLQKRM